ncbi:uncharacterized protein [Miscanthus floridulus]|uniref:uncharacterized protein n=1 Tax=Miscanthus floridulus TaxID=154761 RepID=UPI00345B0C2D
MRDWRAQARASPARPPPRVHAGRPAPPQRRALLPRRAARAAAPRDARAAASRAQPRPAARARRTPHRLGRPARPAPPRAPPPHHAQCAEVAPASVPRLRRARGGRPPRPALRWLPLTGLPAPTPAPRPPPSPAAVGGEEAEGEEYVGGDPEDPDRLRRCCGSAVTASPRHCVDSPLPR